MGTNSMGTNFWGPQKNGYEFWHIFLDFRIPGPRPPLCVPTRHVLAAAAWHSVPSHSPPAPPSSRNGSENVGYEFLRAWKNGYEFVPIRPIWVRNDKHWGSTGLSFDRDHGTEWKALSDKHSADYDRFAVWCAREHTTVVLFFGYAKSEFQIFSELGQDLQMFFRKKYENDLFKVIFFAPAARYLL